MTRQVSRTVRRGTGGKGRTTDLARSLPGTVDTRAEGLTDALEAIQTDAQAEQEDQELARLGERLEALQQQQDAERSHQRDEGMSY
jgi:hypothetical protein